MTLSQRNASRRSAPLPYPWTICAGLLSTLVLFAGCGPSNNRITVSGTVNYDGKPIETGSISFAPVDGKGATTGGVIENGHYSADVSPGEMAVQINGMETITKENPTQEEIERGLAQDTRNYVPAKYNRQSELRITVTPDQTTHDFDLKPE